MPPATSGNSEALDSTQKSARNAGQDYWDIPPTGGEIPQNEMKQIVAEGRVLRAPAASRSTESTPEKGGKQHATLIN